MNSIQLPESLVAQLRSYEKRLRRMETIAAVAGGLAGLWITYVLLFVSDRFINTPAVARAVLTGTGALLAAWFAHSWARYWLWNRRGEADLAKLLQRHFRILGDRLQGVIELTQAEELPENISPALLRAAIHQVAEESGRKDFTEAVPTAPARRWAIAAIVVGGLAAAPFLIAPKAATNAAQRWAMPWADIERYTFTTVEQIPNELFVPHGEKFELAVGLRADAQWKPSSATAHIEGQEKLESTVQENKASFEFPAQTKEGTIHLRFGDYLKDIVVHPLHRPDLKTLVARVQLPGYLGYPEQKTPIHGSAAEFLTGSSVAFEGTISRAVGKGSLSVKGKEHEAMLSDAQFTSPALPLDQLGEEVTLRWADTHGITPIQPRAVRIGSTKDAEPRIELQGIAEQELAILPHENLRFTIAASDDFGLKETWLGWTSKRVGEKAEGAKRADQDWVNSLWEDWKSQSAKKKAKPTGPSEMPRIAGSQTTKEVARGLVWAPSELGIPQDTVVELTGYALDYLPERAPVASMKYVVHVLSPE
jgi:hypothetical protein